MKHKRANRGATVVELALMLPLLVVLIFGMLEMGWLVMKQSQITNAARAGARYAAMPSVTDAGQVTASTSPAMLVLAQNHLTDYATVSVETDVAPPVGELVTVKVRLHYRAIQLCPGLNLLPNTEYLQAKVSMAKEGPAEPT